MQREPKDKEKNNKNQEMQPTTKVEVSGKNIDLETLRVARENLERYLPAMKELSILVSRS